MEINSSSASARPPGRCASSMRPGRCTAIRMGPATSTRPTAHWRHVALRFACAARANSGYKPSGAGRWPAGPAGAQRRTRPRREGIAPEPQPQLHSGTVAGAGCSRRCKPQVAPRRDLWHRDGPADPRHHPPGNRGRVGAGHRPGGGHRGTARRAPAPLRAGLELKAGPVAGLAALAAQWATRHGLYLSTVSKAERGDACWPHPCCSSPAGRPHPPVPAAARRAGPATPWWRSACNRSGPRQRPG